MVGGPSLRSESGRETHPEVQKWSGEPPGSPEMVGGPSRRSGSGRGDPPGGPEVVEGPSRRSGSGRETLPEVRKWSGDLPGGLELV